MSDSIALLCNSAIDNKNNKLLLGILAIRLVMVYIPFYMITISIFTNQILKVKDNLLVISNCIFLLRTL